MAEDEGPKLDQIVEVASEKDSSVTYQVNTTTGECSCPQYQYRLKPLNDQDGGNRSCKHMEMVRRLQAEQ